LAPFAKVKDGHSRPGGLPDHGARILAAMVEVSAERGAANVTVAHIVERSCTRGLSRPR
jgi:hypothetical protein